MAARSRIREGIRVSTFAEMSRSVSESALKQSFIRGYWNRMNGSHSLSVAIDLAAQRLSIYRALRTVGLTAREAESASRGMVEDGLS